MTTEEERLAQDRDRTAYWKRWGPYLSERQWGTVREDYSASGDAWDYFPHDHARSRAYRWGEDGIAGISDNHQRLCFAIALWNGEDPILKERLFGLTGNEGNHGEDVKEYYFYLDNTPTHSYMKYLYKYSHQAFPYTRLVQENRNRTKQDPEFELLDAGVFAQNQYFDVFVEYAKNTPEDVLIEIKIINRGSQPKTLHVLPTLWFRNTWSWNVGIEKPFLKVLKDNTELSVVEASHPTLGERWLYCENQPQLLFTENETNHERLSGNQNEVEYVKDSIHEFVIQNDQNAVNPERFGTKAAAHYITPIASGATQIVRLRLCDSADLSAPFGSEFNAIFRSRRSEADEFYNSIHHPNLSADQRLVQRQASAGMLWNKQFYHYVVETWLKGDPTQPPPDPNRQRNRQWVNLFSDDVLSMPDKWEYPWFAAWDLAFHAVTFALIDPDFAKRQLIRLTREWYMHPNGQLPAYEWAFNDVNPPVHAGAAWKVYTIEQQRTGKSDRQFLERVFQKLLLNFTWWVNREDPEGRNVFEGGFLGMDNIGVFDRSAPLPTGGSLQQADSTSWMGMYCINLLTIALELAQDDSVYEDIASKFFEHFLRISAAMNGIGDSKVPLWNAEDQFYYDVLKFPDGETTPLKVRSLVGVVPLFAVMTLEPEIFERLPNFARRCEWFIQNRPDLRDNIACMHKHGSGDRRLLAIVYPDKLRQILRTLLDEAEFLSPYGLRSVPKFHAQHPYTFNVNGNDYRVDYEPAESTSELFGGNSNWRGPIWFPINWTVIEALLRFYDYLGDEFKVECPTGSGQLMTLQQVAIELSSRLMRIFQKDEQGHRPVFGSIEPFQSDPHWQNLILFHEYFHGENGAGLGASHQTGWTGLIASLLHTGGKTAQF